MLLPRKGAGQRLTALAAVDKQQFKLAVRDLDLHLAVAEVEHKRLVATLLHFTTILLWRSKLPDFLLQAVC